MYYIYSILLHKCYIYDVLIYNLLLDDYLSQYFDTNVSEGISILFVRYLLFVGL